MKNVFEIKPDELLREDLGNEDNRINKNLNCVNAADEISVKINDFYRDQLQINICKIRFVFCR
jgi:hypothetical protein